MSVQSFNRLYNKGLRAPLQASLGRQHQFVLRRLSRKGFAEGYRKALFLKGFQMRMSCPEKLTFVDNIPYAEKLPVSRTYPLLGQRAGKVSLCKLDIFVQLE